MTCKSKRKNTQQTSRRFNAKVALLSPEFSSHPTVNIQHHTLPAASLGNNEPCACFSDKYSIIRLSHKHFCNSVIKCPRQSVKRPEGSGAQTPSACKQLCYVSYLSRCVCVQKKKGLMGDVVKGWVMKRPFMLGDIEARSTTAAYDNRLCEET